MANLREADIKAPCESFLAALQNMGQLLFFRLNAGLMMAEYKGKRRVIRLAPPGTSDNIVILPNGKALFVEYKAPGEKQTEQQLAFERKVEAQGHQYWIVSDTLEFTQAIEEVLNDP